MSVLKLFTLSSKQKLTNSLHAALNQLRCSYEIKWDYINQIREKTSLLLIANGEIWNYQDGQDCIEATGVDLSSVMRF